MKPGLRSRERARSTVRTWLGLAVVLLALAACINLRPLWRDFETVEVRLSFPDEGASRGSRFDAALLANLAHIGYLRSFDHVFAAGPRTVAIERFVWLDRCEVRQGDFYKFVGWQPFHPEVPVAAPGEPAGWRYESNTRDHAISGRLDGPANGVTWYDAYAYCRAAGGRLPHAAEWLAAAAGAEGRLYPWGDAFDSAPPPYLDPLLNAARTCGEDPGADTPEGLADMGGIVSEWATVDDPAMAGVMGGNAYNAPRDLYALAVLYRQTSPDYRSSYLGFRCAYDLPPRTTPWRTPVDAVLVRPDRYEVGVPADARIPSLLAALPREHIPLIGRLLDQGDRPQVTDLYFTAREITRREFAAFLRDPFVAAGFHAEENQPADHRHRPPDWDEQMRFPDLPVVNVDWWSAYAFASWAGGRLPTAEEWESAASDQGRRLYPWGDGFDAASPVTGEQALRGPQVTVADTGDRSAQGLLGLGGNVSEWTRSVSTVSGGYAVVVKGGNYLLPGVSTARFDYRNHLTPNYRSPTVGFRVVFDRVR